jgi:hypothetical protein
MEAARTADFVPCDDLNWEEDFEKIVLIFDKDECFTHAALQIAPGRWKSKFGRLSDFEHSLKAIVGGAHGRGMKFMKRKRRPRKLN